MAVQPTSATESPNPYLSPNQQDLLLAALNSQASSKFTVDKTDTARTLSNQYSSKADIENTIMTSDEAKMLFMSPQDAELDNYDVDFTPDLDYLDGDTSYDFDNADLGGEMIGALPGSGLDKDDINSGEHNDKRKNPDDITSKEEGDAKRQETQEGEKMAKKPGRKPLTSEPTTKRKAQNRAAQRAFRERKEKHLKDLETQVAELTKSQEADKHENGVLKAQVERLQAEVKEYRKRMSLSSSSVGRSPPLSAVGSKHRSSNGLSYGSGFQFDFPKFGALPGSQIFGNQNVNGSTSPAIKHDNPTPSSMASSTPISSRHGSQSNSQPGREGSTGRSLSPRSTQSPHSNATSPSQIANLMPSIASYSTNNNMHGFAGTLPQMGGSKDPFSELFSPSILKTANMQNYFSNSNSPEGNQGNTSTNGNDSGGDNSSGFARAFQFNSGSNISDTTSPSGSSLSQWNMNGAANSSCETSPEPSHDDSANKDKASDAFSDMISPSMPFVNHAQGSSNTFASQADFSDGLNLNHDFNMPSVGNFDPVLFGDYRDSNEAIVGNGDFTGGFFNDALNSTFDYGSPSNLFGILQSPQQVNSSLNTTNNAVATPPPSKNLMAETEKARDGGDDDYGLPKKPIENVKAMGKMISCNNIWNQLQSNPDFQGGKFDLDGLCAELRMKARCSESGVMVDQNHVDAALKKLGKKNEDGKVQDPPRLMFEQESWDKVLQKLGGK